MPKKVIRIKHKANSGDLIASLAGIKKFSETMNQKMVVCQQINAEAAYYEGATHPVVDDANKDQFVMVNGKMFSMLRPLLLYQDYIEDFEIYKGQNITIDLDKIRGEIFTNLPYGAIQQWVMFAYPDLATDLSKAWIKVPDKIDIDLSDKILINFTERYRNYTVDYFFLKKYKKYLVFAGTEKEHSIFCHKWNLKMPRLQISDFLELATAIKGCKFLLGNQSFCWNIAEALKSPRVLEVCTSAPNCQPFIGESSFGYLHQGALTYYVKYLMK